jgi:hypothetical protein
MYGNLKSLLRKATSLSPPSTYSNGSSRWPENVLPYLENKFHLLPKEMLHLQCTRYLRKRNGMSMDFIRIFDRERAFEQGVNIKKYRDLDRHPHLVKFEGFILKNGTVHLHKNNLIKAS